jgi:Plasmid pRiA4b ORF-3-like protein
MAILRFRIYFEEDDSVYRDVVVRHKQTFFDFHTAILKSYDFDTKHQATFYRSNDNWQKGKEISLEKYEKEYVVEPLIMQETAIGTQIFDPSQKFIYEYDFVKHWSFLIELINVSKEEDPKMTYPSTIRKEGIGPSQYGTRGLMGDNKLTEVEEKYDLSAIGAGFIKEGEALAEEEETGLGEEETSTGTEEPEEL